MDNHNFTLRRMVYEKKERFIINKILITGGAGFIGGNFIINQILSQKNI